MSINPLFRDHINFRDLGGYKSIDGRSIKPGLLFRSGGLYLLNEQETENFLALGIKSIMDLRTSSEAEERPDPVFPNIEVVRHSGVAFRGGSEIDFSPVGMSKIGKEGEEQLMLLKQYYNEIPFDNEALRLLMSKVADGSVPLLFHCHTGKDRTGVFAMVLLLALGIDEETVFQDFMLSNEFHKETIEQELSLNKEKIKEHPVLRELICMRTGVTETIGRSVISEIQNRHGSIEKYFRREFSMDENSLSNLRDMYLE